MKEKETIEYLDLKHLVPFRNHPFKLRNGEEKEQLLQSIRTQGAIEPLIVRPLSESKYEVISGHRRMEIGKELGIEKIPVIVRNLTDEQAVSMMVDANLHRENISPSERAFAYKMKMEAMKHQGERTDLTSGQLGRKSDGKESREIIAEQTGESARQVQRFINLTNLIPELLDMVDRKEIAFNPAVELSFLKKEEQQGFLEAMDYGQSTPSLSQAQRIKKLSQAGMCTQEAMNTIMNEEKKSELDTVTLKNDVLRKYFPRSYTPKQMQDTIIRLLEQWQKKRQRDQSR